MPSARVPTEPAEACGDRDDGDFRIIPTLDFSSDAHEKGTLAYRDRVLSHMSDFEEQCRELCGDSSSSSTASHAWRKSGESKGIVCEHLSVAGTNIPLVRHTSTLDFPAEIVFGVYHALTYSSIIDPYAFHVECRDIIDFGEAAGYDWAHVTWTVDSILPLFAARDFCTLDFVNSKEMMSMSKSVEHPLVPRTAPPTTRCMLKRKTVNSRTYRVPLVYALKVAPMGEGRCKLTQLQWSDVGGIIPENKISESVDRFGYDSIKRLSRVISHVTERDLCIPGFTSPILPSWERKADRIIPGLDNSY